MGVYYKISYDQSHCRDV